MNYILSFFILASVLSKGICDDDFIMDLISSATSGLDLGALFDKANNLDKKFERKFIQKYLEGMDNPEIHYNFTQLVSHNNYPVEEHTVVTEDGYVITIFRIPGKGPPVLLQHGLVNCADDIVTGGVEGGLAYFAADEGYDVWLGSTRGNKYGLRHKTLSPDSWEFWDNSWNEIGIYDLPAIVDYILKETGHDQLTYAGHSQGTTSFLVFLSERPEYNKKIKLGILLSTIAYMYHMPNMLLRPLLPILYLYPELFYLGLHSLPPTDSLSIGLRNAFCSYNELTELVCGNVFFLGYGFDASQLNWPRLAVQYGHAPSISSVKQFVHYAQSLLTNAFRKFDYGIPGNLEIYGTMEPPEYQLERITAPIAMFHSYGDLLSSIKDVNQVKNRLPNVVEFYEVPHSAFNHQDYFWAKDIKNLIYNKMSELFKKYNEDVNDNSI